MNFYLLNTGNMKWDRCTPPADDIGHHLSWPTDHPEHNKN